MKLNEFAQQSSVESPVSNFIHVDWVVSRVIHSRYFPITLSLVLFAMQRTLRITTCVQSIPEIVSRSSINQAIRKFIEEISVEINAACDSWIGLSIRYDGFKPAVIFMVLAVCRCLVLFSLLPDWPLSWWWPSFVSCEHVARCRFFYTRPIVSVPRDDRRLIRRIETARKSWEFNYSTSLKFTDLDQ